MFKFNSRIHKARTPIEIINLINVGGLNFSNIVEVFGASKSGKTTFCYQMAEYLLEDYGDVANVLILDAEGAAGNSDRLEMVFNLRIGEDPRVERAPAMTIEMANDAILRATARAKTEGKILLIIWDSIKVSSFNNAKKAIDAQMAAADAKGEEGAPVERGMTEPLARAQVMAWCLNNTLHAIYDRPVLVLLINQISTKVNQFNTSVDSSGGLALRHNVNERIRLDFVKNIGGDKKGDLFKTGTMSHLSLIKSRTIPSLQDVPVTISDVDGGRIDLKQQVPLLAHQMGILTAKSGGWYSLAEEHHFPGMPEEAKKSMQYKEIAENPAYVEVLRHALTNSFRAQFKLVDFVHKRYEEATQGGTPVTPEPKAQPVNSPAKAESAAPKKPLSGAAAAAAAKRASKT